jgi:hypothetical protein
MKADNYIHKAELQQRTPMLRTAESTSDNAAQHWALHVCCVTIVPSGGQEDESIYMEGQCADSDPSHS